MPKRTSQPKEPPKKPASEEVRAEVVPAAKAEPEAPAAVPSNGKTILIVEDERPLAHALQMKLKSEGYQTKVVMNGTDALEEAKKGGIALILLDLIMPLMDGFGVLQELKARGSTTPVIVLSNLGQDEDKAKAKELGATEYYVKSNIPIAEIITHIKALC